MDPNETLYQLSQELDSIAIVQGLMAALDATIAALGGDDADLWPTGYPF